MEKNSKEIKTFKDYMMRYSPEIQQRLEENTAGNKNCNTRSKRKD